MSEQQDEHRAEGSRQSTEPSPDDVDLDWCSEPLPVCANGAHAVHTHREFAIFFTDLVLLPGRGSAGGDSEPRARVVGSVRMSPDLLFQTVATLASNYNRFVQRFGDPRNTPRFKLVGARGFQLEGLEASEPTEDHESR